MGESIKTHSTKETRREIDRHVGERLRYIRNLRGISQEKLANQVNLTFQQLQKYESGKNRISASVLFEFSQILEVPIKEFFEGLSTSQARPLPELSKDHYALIAIYSTAPKKFQKALLNFLETSRKALKDA